MGIAVEIDAVDADAYAEWHQVEARTFGGFATQDTAEVQRLVIDFDRVLAARVDGRIVGTACAFPFAMTVPGGTALPVAGVSSVTVAPTHRRQGILGQLMRTQLDDVAARGETVAVLNASEAAIYRRFGYGWASSFQTIELDTHHVMFREPVGADFELRIYDRPEIAAAGAANPLPAIHDAWRRVRPGALSHSDPWWEVVLHRTETWTGGGEFFVVTCTPGDDRPGGYAIYTMDRDHRPGSWRVTARYVVAADPLVEARLLRYLAEIDLVGHVELEWMPMDTALPWWLTDLRQARTTYVRDYLWVRLVDVVGALTTRTYGSEDELVLGVRDHFLPAAEGHYRLRARDGDVFCERTTAPADIELDIAELGSLFLGGISAHQLAAAGLLAARRPDGVDRLERLFRGPVAPFSVTHF